MTEKEYENKLEMYKYIIQERLNELYVGKSTCVMLNSPVEFIGDIENELKKLKNLYYLIYRFSPKGEVDHAGADIFIFRYKFQANVIRYIIKLTEENDIKNLKDAFIKEYLLEKILGYSDECIEATIKELSEDAKEEFKVDAMDEDQRKEYLEKKAQQLAKEYVSE